MRYVTVLFGVLGVCSILGVAYFWVYVIDQSNFIDLEKSQWADLASFLSDSLAPILSFLSLLALALTLTLHSKQLSHSSKATEAAALLQMVERLGAGIISDLKSHQMSYEDEDGYFGPSDAYTLIMDEKYDFWAWYTPTYVEGQQQAGNSELRWGVSHRASILLRDIGLALSLLRTSVMRYEIITGDESLRAYYSLKFLLAYERLYSKDYVDGILEHPVMDKIKLNKHSRL